MTMPTLEVLREILRSTIAMYRLDGVLVLAPSWGIAVCKCREADGFILATEFDLRLAVVSDTDKLPCGAVVLCRINEEAPAL